MSFTRNYDFPIEYVWNVNRYAKTYTLYQTSKPEWYVWKESSEISIDRPIKKWPEIFINARIISIYKIFTKYERHVEYLEPLDISKFCCEVRDTKAKSVVCTCILSSSLLNFSSQICRNSWSFNLLQKAALKWLQSMGRFYWLMDWCFYIYANCCVLGSTIRKRW